MIVSSLLISQCTPFYAQLLHFQRFHTHQFQIFLESPNAVCCGLVQKYPDLIPGVTWGGMKNNEEGKKQWTKTDCHNVVGGKSKSNCGRYFYIEFAHKTKRLLSRAKVKLVP